MCPHMAHYCRVGRELKFKDGKTGSSRSLSVDVAEDHVPGGSPNKLLGQSRGRVWGMS